MATGTVKFFIPPWGWGFITHKNELGSHDDCLVHYTDIESDMPYKKLYKGQTVEFTKIKHDKGFRAVNIKPSNIHVTGKKVGKI